MTRGWPGSEIGARDRRSSDPRLWRIERKTRHAGRRRLCGNRAGESPRRPARSLAPLCAPLSRPLPPPRLRLLCPLRRLARQRRVDLSRLHLPRPLPCPQLPQHPLERRRTRLDNNQKGILFFVVAGYLLTLVLYRPAPSKRQTASASSPSSTADRATSSPSSARTHRTPTRIPLPTSATPISPRPPAPSPLPASPIPRPPGLL
jgi:hypothetical protein